MVKFDYPGEGKVVDLLPKEHQTQLAPEGGRKTMTMMNMMMIMMTMTMMIILCFLHPKGPHDDIDDNDDNDDDDDDDDDNDGFFFLIVGIKYLNLLYSD